MAFFTSLFKEDCYLTLVLAHGRPGPYMKRPGQPTGFFEKSKLWFLLIFELLAEIDLVLSIFKELIENISIGVWYFWWILALHSFRPPVNQNLYESVKKNYVKWTYVHIWNRNVFSYMWHICKPTYMNVTYVIHTNT